jgi:UDP-N-acetylglucosamine 1-carboxyvinyltransferase
MGIFKIEGGIRLKGEITPQGAKTSITNFMCFVLLTSEKL